MDPTLCRPIMCPAGAPHRHTLSDPAREIGATHYLDAGFSITEAVFERREMQRAARAVADAELPRTKAGVRNALRVPLVRALASCPDLARLAATFIGENPIVFRATVFDKSARSNWLVPWHQDTALPVRQRVQESGWGPWSNKGGVLHAIAPAAALASVVALRVHLDDSTDANGPLRVLPGTHSRGVLTHGEIQRFAAAIKPVECVAAAGGVVVLRPLLVHASSKVSNSHPRRVLHIEYAASRHLGAGIELAVG